MKDGIFKAWQFWVLAFVILTLPIISSYYKYYYTKDYDYLIEAKCDPSMEKCFFRDCADYCPPNGLSNYKEFYVKAFEFSKCSNNSCELECNNGSINCVPIPCGES